MIVTKTPGGADVVDMTPAEYAAFIERRVQRAMANEFRQAFLAGELDEVNPVSERAGRGASQWARTTAAHLRRTAHGFVDHLNSVLNPQSFRRMAVTDPKAITP